MPDKAPATAVDARPRASFADGTRSETLDGHTYRIHLHADFCVGAVPNGGYVASCMLAVANAYLSLRGQSDTFTAHFEYVQKTAPGSAIVVVDEVKLGRQISTLHVTLWQGGQVLDHAPWFVASSSRRKVLAYTNHVELAAFTGLSIPTGYEETAAAMMPAVPDFNLLKTVGTDGVWAKGLLPNNPIRKGSPEHWYMLIPRHGPLTPGVCDIWISATAGQPLTQAALPYVVDAFPFELLTLLATSRSFDPVDPGEIVQRRKSRYGLWLPTVLLNLEVKKRLPSQGVEWLNLSITAKQIKNGRMDLAITVRDLAGELVALGSQVSLIVSMERNTGNGTGSGKGPSPHEKAAL
ncbi:hypothetical protein E4U61_002270 [Claviceps capensis]|nr:hypothetical protein E4U61_002270 [Claviceps capensis]